MAVQDEPTTYIALFHHRDNAASAIRDLEAAGFTRGALTVIGGGNGSSYSDAKGSYGEGYGYGDQSGLASIGVPQEDREHLQDGLVHGGVVLSLEGAGEDGDEIERIFSKHSTKKINEKEAERVAPITPVAAAAVSPRNVDQAVIPVTQEELVVGKREVDRGGVRVFRRIVEEPVSEAVNLRDERVVVDRRPVNREVTDADLLRGNEVIELTETAEVAVVGKTARVVEEVRVGKEATEHTETIHDTVRRTEVDVEQRGSIDSSNPSTKY